MTIQIDSIMAVLIHEHREIVGALEEIATAMRREPAVEADEIGRIRARFGTAARKHLASEEALVFGPLKASGLLEDMPEINQIMQDMRAEWSTYSANIREWTLAAIMADRAGYLGQVEQRTALLKNWNRIEEEEVYRPVLMALASLPQKART